MIVDPETLTLVGTTDPIDYRLIEKRFGSHYSRKILPFQQFMRAASLYPDKIALISPGKSLGYRELADAADQMASGLHAMGVKAGQAVVAIMDNRWEHLPLFLAIARLGAVHVTINYQQSDDFILAELAELHPGLIIGRHGIPVEDIMAAADGPPPAIFADEHAPLCIRHSSGTTGKPKKTIASQRASALVYQELATELQLTAKDVHLAVGSLAHAALQIALMQLMVGGTVVVHPFNPQTLWADCTRLGITNLLLMPAMLAATLDHVTDPDRPLTIFTAGATLAAPLKRRLLARLPALRLYDLYTATEAGHITSLRPSDQRLKPTSAGRPYFSTELGIFDDSGIAIPSGESGHIYARGPMATDAYFGDAKPLPSPVRLAADGWIRLGDIGRLDEDGFLYLSDRSVDVFACNGQQILPSEVEAVIRDYGEPGELGEIAVIGVPDPQSGYRIVAYIEGTASADGIAEHCEGALPDHKRPSKIIFVPALPRTTSAKISRHLIRQAVADGALPS